MKYFYATCAVFALLLLPETSAISAKTTEPKLLVETLAKHFAPQVRFHSKEKYFPSSVEWFTKRSELRKREADDKTSLVLKRPIESPSVLGQYSTQDYPQDTKKENNYFLNPLPNDETRAGKPLVDGKVIAPCYYHVQDTTDGLIIQYLFHYPYNGYTVGATIAGKELLAIGDHEGDWEHIDVRLKKVGNKVPGNYLGYKLERIHFAAHGNYPFGNLLYPKEITFVDDSHPVVWAAQWGHANHGKNVGFQVKSLDHTDNDGAFWNCWQVPLINVGGRGIGDEDKPTKGNEWLIFGGRWGSTKEEKDKKITTRVANSPQSPALSAWWRSAPYQLYKVRLFDNRNKKLTVKPGSKSDYFDLKGRIPTRAAKIMWEIEHPQADDIIFSVHERRYLLKDRKNIYGPMDNKTVTPISIYDKGLYIADIKSKSGKKINGLITINLHVVDD